MEGFEPTFLGKILSSDESCTDKCAMPIGEFPKETPLAMAYVPFQTWETPYDNETGLSRGTIFPRLDKPFIGEEAVKCAK